MRQLQHPLANAQAYAFSALFSSFLIIAYLMLVAFTHLPRETHQRP